MRLAVVGCLMGCVLGQDSVINEYISSMPFPVDIVTPKYSFIGYEKYAASYCDIETMELLSNIVLINDGVPAMDPAAAKAEKASQMDAFLAAVPHYRKFHESGASFRQALDFTQRLLRHTDALNQEATMLRRTNSSNDNDSSIKGDSAQTTASRRMSMNYVPVLLPEDVYSPEEKLRALIATHFSVQAGGQKLGTLVKLHSEMPEGHENDVVMAAIHRLRSRKTGGNSEQQNSEQQNSEQQNSEQQREQQNSEQEREQQREQQREQTAMESIAGYLRELWKSSKQGLNQEKALDELFNKLVEDDRKGVEKKGEAMDGDQNPWGLPEGTLSFFMSNAFGEMFSALFQDVGEWIDGLNGYWWTDGGKVGLAEGLCRGIQAGLQVDGGMSPWTSCALPSAFFAYIVCGNTQLQIDCTNYKFADPSLDLCDMFEAQEVYDLSLIPMEEGVDATVNHFSDAGYEKDGRSMWLMQSSIAKQAMSTTQRQCMIAADDPDFLLDLLPGWDIVHETWLNEETSYMTQFTTNKYVPYSTIAKKRTTATDGTCEFMMISRGTINGWEWWVDFKFEMKPIPYSTDPEALAHSGYLNLATPIVEANSNYMMRHHFDVPADTVAGEDLYNQYSYCDPNKTSIWFVGHSLGGGMSNLQSLIWGLRWKTAFPQMQLYNFAAASFAIYNENTRAMHSKLVNSRNVRYERDFVPGIMCQNTGATRCAPNPFASGLHGAGLEQPTSLLSGAVILRSKEDFVDYDPDNQWWFGDDHFFMVPGLLQMTTILSFINMPMILQPAACHLCSYRCYFSSHFCTKDVTNQTECFRGPVNYDNEANCVNQQLTIPDVKSKNDGPNYLGSLNCTFNEQAFAVKQPCWYLSPGIRLNAVQDLIN
ncbi:lipase [Gregarina niphandrodes]|uniref:Lipase n=1 Tax=Gregarina niphandrodes TaxID=110365 RepID=A0A023AYC5_GRENI|nr:lipase [Gregarina niphandrodes]EZG43661.1 lipase [Gregarina niphandrodes]|eukprot:XP_011133107.1 lipase [Gregarina niphandrodes]